MVDFTTSPESISNGETPCDQIGLFSAGRITEGCGCGALFGSAVEAIAANDIVLDGFNHIGTGDNGGGLALTPGIIAMQVTGAGDSLVNTLFFGNIDASLTVAGPLAVSAGSLTLPSLSGVTTNGGDLTLGVQQLTPGAPQTTLTLLKLRKTSSKQSKNIFTRSKVARTVKAGHLAEQFSIRV